MNRRLLNLNHVYLCALFLAFQIPCQASTLVRFDTVFGDIDVRLFDTATPESIDNFLTYVERGDYINTLIHRSVPGFIIQGGNWNYDGTPRVEPQDFPQVNSLAPVINEPGLTNVRGTIAYAKLGGDPDSATNQWFFNLGDNSANLNNQNGGFTVFGQVVGDGLQVVDAIAALQTFPFLGAFSDGPVRNYTVADFQGFTPLGADNLAIVESVSVLDIDPADYNFDGVVDFGDLEVWEAQLGSSLLISDQEISSPNTSSEADGNGDGRVDGLDFLVWQQNFGNVVSGSFSALSVPEPTTFALASLSLLAFFARRR